MLVLTRKLGEKILIGGDITITVVEIGRSRLKLGIEAPAGQRILRSELVATAESPGAERDAGAGDARHRESLERPLRRHRMARRAEAVGA